MKVGDTFTDTDETEAARRAGAPGVVSGEPDSIIFNGDHHRVRQALQVHTRR